MTDHLAALFTHTPAADAERVVYLLQGRIAPQFEGSEIGFGEKLIAEGIAKATGYSREEVDAFFNTSGDLGDTAEQLVAKKKQRALFSEPLTVEKVFTNLKKMAHSEGTGSQELKKKLLAELFNSASPLEARYLARIPLGNIRLGIGDPTIMDAFALVLSNEEQTALTTKKNEASKKSEVKKIEDAQRKIKTTIREQIEAAYNVDSDLGSIAHVLKVEGLSGLKKITIRPGTPIRPTAAERLPSAKEIIEKLGTCAVEAKYDGFRVQLSKNGNTIKIFSRQSEDITDMFPEITAAAISHLNAESCIVEGEALAFNEATQEYYPFQVTIQRKRKYEVEKKAKEYPLRMFLFDVMYVNGTSYLDTPLKQRRKILTDLVTNGSLIQLSEQKIVSTAEELETFFEEKIAQGLEGIMAKDLDAPYIAGARKFAWIKLKRSYKGTLEDTLDVVIIGYDTGKGKRTAFGLGALLVAAYNPTKDMFESVAKIGTGMTEDTLTELEGILSKSTVTQKPARVTSEIVPDHWVSPRYVIETRADEITLSPLHSCGKVGNKGYALRFPRMIKLRTDRSAESATTVEEVKGMFSRQKRVSLEDTYGTEK